MLSVLLLVASLAKVNFGGDLFALREPSIPHCTAAAMESDARAALGRIARQSPAARQQEQDTLIVQTRLEVVAIIRKEVDAEIKLDKGQSLPLGMRGVRLFKYQLINEVFQGWKAYHGAYESSDLEARRHHASLFLHRLRQKDSKVFLNLLYDSLQAIVGG